MKINLITSLLFFFILLNFSSDCLAQFTNNGTEIVLQEGALISTEGDFYNKSGTILHLGTINIKGDWINDDARGAFTDPSTGIVNFLGVDQLIKGAQTTIFPNVTLLGTGIKSLETNTKIRLLLNMNDLEFALNRSDLEILNPDTSSIMYTTGFVSTENRGMLYRSTDTTKIYIFPLAGHRITSTNQDTISYRPVTLKVRNDLPNVFGASFINRDPSTEGFNRGSKRNDIQEVNDLYFHIIDQKEGSSNADFKFYYNSMIDGDFNQLANWNQYSLWEKIGIANAQVFRTLHPQVDKYMTYQSIDPINKLAIAFVTIKPKNDPITFYNSFTPDGDGINDTWEIRNLDLFPDNTLTIVNRWGSEIVRVKGYNRSNAWDGNGVPSGTYFYVLKARVNGEDKVYKGSITLMRQ